MNIKLVIFLLFIFNSGHFLYGQKGPTAYWSSIFINSRLSAKWSNITDFSYRVVDNNLIPFQNLSRTLMRYHLNEQINLNQGIAYINTKTSFEQSNQEYGHEIRLYQELNRLSIRSKRFTLDHRLRLEERFLSKTSKREKSFVFRFPYRILAGYRLSSNYTLLLGYEHMHSFGQNNLFLDQQRYITQLQWRIPYDIQLGFMYMYVHRPTYNQNLFHLIFNKFLNFESRNRTKN